MEYHERDVIRRFDGSWSVGWALMLLAMLGCDAPASRVPEPNGTMTDEPRVTRGDCADYLRDAGPAELRRGTDIWNVLCIACHGETGAGGTSSRLQDIRPPDLTDVARAASFGEDERIRIIADGVPGTTMIGWKGLLTEGEIRAVYRHVCSLGVDRPDGDGK
ncbi:MAG: hypothetical protein GY946_11865 [bacterium]|nr:hypothetical protein [bacterium]